LLEPVTVDVWNVPFECVRHLDLQQVLFGAIHVQNTAAIAPRPDLQLRKELGRSLLDGLGRRQRRQQYESIFYTRLLFGEFEAHLERQIVVVVPSLVDEHELRTVRFSKVVPTAGREHQSDARQNQSALHLVLTENVSLRTIAGVIRQEWIR